MLGYFKFVLRRAAVLTANVTSTLVNNEFVHIIQLLLVVSRQLVCKI